jgi:hypothetical protein
MRNRNKNDTPSGEQMSFDPDVDRYPDLKRLFSRIEASDAIPDGPVERLEITCLAGGEATCRVWPARALEPEGVFLEAE